MHHEIIVSGFGGQGVLFAGQLLALAAVSEGRHVTWIPSYGPEMRGGTAHATVIISDEEIGSPFTSEPTAAIVLNNPSMDKYESKVRRNGVLLLDAAIIDKRTKRKDIQEIAVPAKEIAEDIGLPKAANVVIVGALAAATGVVSIDSIERVLREKLAERHADTLAANLHALKKGEAFAESVLAHS